MKRRTTLSILIAMVLLVVTSFVVYAAFTFTTKTVSNINNFEISFSDDNQKITSPESLSSTFSKAGDYQEFEFTIQNNTSEIISYDVYLSNCSDSATEGMPSISNSVLVYNNSNTFVGVASDYAIASQIETELILLPGASITYSVSLELHNAIEVENYTDTSITLDVEFHAKTVDVKKYSIVTNEDEFAEVIDSVNYGYNKTIILGNNLTLTKNYSIGNTCTIDLNNCNLSGGALNISNNEKSCVLTIKGNGEFTSNVSISSSYSFLDILDDVQSSATITFESYDVSKINDIILRNIKSNYIYEESEGNVIGIDLLKNNKFYNPSLSVVTEFYKPSDDQYNASISNYILTADVEIKSYVVRIAYLTYNYDILVLGKQTNDVVISEDGVTPVEYQTILDFIVSTELKHISYYKTPTTNEEEIVAKTLASDLFLPTSLKKYNCSIVWQSSDASIISDDGTVAIGAEGDVTLTAYIRINDQQYIVEFDISIAKETNEMKLHRLISKLNIILTKLYSDSDIDSYYTLPSVDNYAELTGDLGIVDLKYSIDMKYTYLQFYNTYDLGLSSITFDKYAQINVEAKFEGTEKIETGLIDVIIDLSTNEDLIDLVMQELQIEFDKVDVLANMLETRKQGLSNEKGDFSLITFHKGFDIEYDEYETETGLTNYCYSFDNENDMLIIHPEYFTSTSERIPLKVKIMVNGENVNKDDKPVYFTVPGAIHCDENGFNDSTLFYSIKMQVLQQSIKKFNDEAEDNEEDIPYNFAIPNTFEGISNIFTEVEHNDYILIADILKCDTLIVKTGTNNKLSINSQDLSELKAIINWALGDKEKDTIDLGFIDNEYSWIKSNGDSYITDGEETVVLSYASKYPYFEAYWNSILYKNKKKDNVLTQQEQKELEAILTDIIFNSLIEWMTLETDTVVSFEDYLSSVDSTIVLDEAIANIIGDYENDGNKTISSLEEEAIVRYSWYKGYSNFYPKWREYISYMDMDINYSTNELLSNFTLTNYLYGYSSAENGNDNAQFFKNGDVAISILEIIYNWQALTSSPVSFLDYFIDNTKVNENNVMTKKEAESILAIFGLTSEYTSTKSEYASGIGNRTINIISTGEYNLLKQFILYNYYNYRSYEYNNTTYYDYFSNDYYEEVTEPAGLLGAAGRRFTQNGYNDLISLIKEATTQIISNTSKDYTFYSKENFNNILLWATSTNVGVSIPKLYYYSNNSKVELTEYSIYDYSYSASDFTVTQYNSIIYNDVVSDGLSSISYPEYLVIMNYLMSDCYNTPRKIYAKTSGVDIAARDLYDFINMKFSNNNLSNDEHTNDGGEIVGLINSLGVDLSDFNKIISWAKTFGSDKCVKQNIVNSNIVADGLNTISEDEYDIITNYINNSLMFDNSTKNLFNNKLNIFLTNLNDNKSYTASLSEFNLYYNDILPFETLTFSNYYYLETSNFNENVFNGLKEFINLNSIYFNGTKNTFMFTTNDIANEVFLLISSYCKELNLLDIKYMNVSTIDSIVNLNKLVSIDLKGNIDIDSISIILDIDKGQIKYLNIHEIFSDLEFEYIETMYNKLYYSYLNNNSPKTPILVYSSSGLETIYKPYREYSNDELLAMEYLYYLKEIRSITSERLILTTDIIVSINPDNSPVSYEITWKVETPGGLETKIDENCYFERITNEECPNVVVSATIDINGSESGGSYTRYFVVELPKISTEN